jgi:hypothetical protein
MKLSEVVVRRSERGWRVGPEETTDLTSAMVLADLMADDLPTVPEARTGDNPDSDNPNSGSTDSNRTDPGSTDSDNSDSGSAVSDRADSDEAGQDAAQLAVTVEQLTRALATRVRVEQAIGVLAERHRLRPRQAFDLMRTAARSRGQKITEIAGTVVDSASNPLLPLPGELERPVVPRKRGPSPRRSRAAHSQ